MQIVISETNYTRIPSQGLRIHAQMIGSRHCGSVDVALDNNELFFSYYHLMND